MFFVRFGLDKTFMYDFTEITQPLLKHFLSSCEREKGISGFQQHHNVLTIPSVLLFLIIKPADIIYPLTELTRYPMNACKRAFLILPESEETTTNNRCRNCHTTVVGYFHIYKAECVSRDRSWCQLPVQGHFLRKFVIFSKWKFRNSKNYNYREGR